VDVGGASVALPFEPELWALGQATHAAWACAKLPKSCAFFNLHGKGLSTPYDVQYGVWWYPLQVRGGGGVSVLQGHFVSAGMVSGSYSSTAAALHAAIPADPSRHVQAFALHA